MCGRYYRRADKQRIEWKKLDPKTKQPFAIAGLWDAWKDPATGDWLQSFAIITTDPNEVTGDVHTRMQDDRHARMNVADARP